MNLSPVKVVRENTGGLRKRPATRPGTISGTGINRSSGRAANDPRATLRGGRRLSEPVGAGGELALRVLLRELVEAQIRRVCRKQYNFDWSAFVEGGGDRLMTGILRFREGREGRRRGLDLRLTDIAIGTVVEVVGGGDRGVDGSARAAADVHEVLRGAGAARGAGAGDAGGEG